MALAIPGFCFKGNGRPKSQWSLWVSLCLVGALAAPVPAMAATVVSGRAYVIDGDTLVIRRVHVRLFGVDAFEHDQTCGRMPCGRQATEALRDMVAGQTIICTRQDTDRYGRTVAICMAGNRDLGREMVRKGLAVAYRTFSQRYITDESAARAARAGAWSHGFDSPLNWRKAYPRQ